MGLSVSGIGQYWIKGFKTGVSAAKDWLDDAADRLISDDTAEAVGEAASVSPTAACGGDFPHTSDAETDGGDSCRNARIIDDFSDGNLTAENIGGNWQAGPGSSIVGSSEVLRAEGSREIAVELNVTPRWPENYVGDHDVLAVDIKAGRLDNPDAPFSGIIRIYMDGLSTVGTASSETQATVMGPNRSDTYELYYAIYGEPSFSLSQVIKIRIVLEVEDSAGYFMEIDNVKLCSVLI